MKLSTPSLSPALLLATLLTLAVQTTLLAPLAAAQDSSPEPGLQDGLERESELASGPAPGSPPAGEQAEAARALARLLARSQEPYPPIESSAISPTGREAEIEEAVRLYRETGDASIIKRSDEVIFPFDASQPVVHCSPLRTCDIQLQAGEIVTGVAVGDSERWMAAPLMSGDPAAPTPHVILKPRSYDAVTNIVIATSRRTYHLGLVSLAMGEVTSGRLAYHRRVAFYYPDELVEYWADAERLAVLRQEAQRHEGADPEALRAAPNDDLAASGALDLGALNFAYTTKADKRATWIPSVVFDDGHHVYLRLPRHAITGELPALLVETDAGQLGVANYRVNDRWYVVDTIFRRAVLVRGVGKKQHRVEILNLRRNAAS